MSAEASSSLLPLEFPVEPVAEAARRLAGVARRTPLVPLDLGPLDLGPPELGDLRLEVRAKLENRQETGSFKVRGAWNQISLLDAAERAAGVVAASSGNHGKALAWAARRAGVRATIVMPADAYPNKIAACRELGAEVVLTETRAAADVACAELAAGGARLVHPYDDPRTVQGAGTVGLEIAEDWPEVDVVVFPVGGGGLLAGSALALRERLGARVAIVGAEPSGAPSMTLGLRAGAVVTLSEITTKVQGLCPTSSGALNIALCARLVDEIVLVEDEEVFAAQRLLVARGETVEPAGAATLAAVRAGRLPARLLERAERARGLRVCVVVSGGNPDPAQLAALDRAS